MRVAAVISDLMLFSRIESAARAAGASLLRVDSPADLPADDALDLILVDWSARQPNWANALRRRIAARIRTDGGVDVRVALGDRLLSAVVGVRWLATAARSTSLATSRF